MAHDQWAGLSPGTAGFRIQITTDADGLSTVVQMKENTSHGKEHLQATIRRFCLRLFWFWLLKPETKKK